MFQKNNSYIGREYPIAPLRNRDDTAKPTPLAERIMISTNSRFLLKYWATINVDVSLVMPTPTPVHNRTNEIDTWLEFQLWDVQITFISPLYIFAIIFPLLNFITIIIFHTWRQYESTNIESAKNLLKMSFELHSLHLKD